MTTKPHESSISSAPEKAWAKTLVELLDVITAALTRRRRTTTNEVQGDAHAIILEIANFFGGRQLYLPRGHRLRIALRDAELASRFTGANVKELAEHYRMTTIHVYSILRKQRALRRERAKADESQRSAS